MTTKTITLHKTIPGHAPGQHDTTFIVGNNHSASDGRRYVRLGLEDATGDRDLEVMEGDTFEFAGARWIVSKVYEPTTSTRGTVAELTKVSESAD